MPNWDLIITLGILIPLIITEIILFGLIGILFVVKVLKSGVRKELKNIEGAFKNIKKEMPEIPPGLHNNNNQGEGDWKFIFPKTKP